jgi:thioredoxin-related protein
MPSLKEKLFKKFFPLIGIKPEITNYAVRHEDGTVEKMSLEEIYRTYKVTSLPPNLTQEEYEKHLAAQQQTQKT